MQKAPRAANAGAFYDIANYGSTVTNLIGSAIWVR